MAVDRPRTRMAEDDRRADGIHRVVHGLLAHMAEVHQHPQPGHFLHHLHAERGQAAVAGGVGGAVRPVERARMGQRHVAGAKVVHLPQHCQAVGNGAAAFHAQQGCDPPAGHGLLHLVGGSGELQLVGIARDEPLHHVDLLDRGDHRPVLRQAGRDIDRPELRPHPAFAQAWQIGMERWATPAAGRHGKAIGEVERADDIVITRAQLPRQVVVAIPHRRIVERCFGRGFGRLGAHRNGGEQSKGQGAGKGKQFQRGDPFSLGVASPSLIAITRFSMR